MLLLLLMTVDALDTHTTPLNDDGLREEPEDYTATLHSEVHGGNVKGSESLAQIVEEKKFEPPTGKHGAVQVTPDAPEDVVLLAQEVLLSLYALDEFDSGIVAEHAKLHKRTLGSSDDFAKIDPVYVVPVPPSETSPCGLQYDKKYGDADLSDADRSIHLYAHYATIAGWLIAEWQGKVLSSARGKKRYYPVNDEGEELKVITYRGDDREEPIWAAVGSGELLEPYKFYFANGKKAKWDGTSTTKGRLWAQHNPGM